MKKHATPTVWGSSGGNDPARHAHCPSGPTSRSLQPDASGTSACGVGVDKAGKASPYIKDPSNRQEVWIQGSQPWPQT